MFHIIGNMNFKDYWHLPKTSTSLQNNKLFNTKLTLFDIKKNPVQINLFFIKILCLQGPPVFKIIY